MRELGRLRMLHDFKLLGSQHEAARAPVRTALGSGVRPGRDRHEPIEADLGTQRALLAVPDKVVPVIRPCSSVIARKLCGASHSPEARTRPSSPMVPSILVSGPKRLRAIRPYAISAEVVPAGV